MYAWPVEWIRLTSYNVYKDLWLKIDKSKAIKLFEISMFQFSFNDKTIILIGFLLSLFLSLSPCLSGFLAQSPSRLETSEQTTGRQLQRVLHYSMAPCRSLPGLRRAECAIHDVDCDEVYPGIYIGDAWVLSLSLILSLFCCLSASSNCLILACSAAAKNKNYLRMMGITHVLNAAEGCRYGQVDTGHSYYRDMPSIRWDGNSHAGKTLTLSLSHTHD